MHFDHGVYVWIAYVSYYANDNKSYLHNIYAIAQVMPNLKICMIRKNEHRLFIQAALNGSSL
jgi:hypothetical protein